MFLNNYLLRHEQKMYKGIFVISFCFNKQQGQKDARNEKKYYSLFVFQ